jgi:hypothetical protein
MSKTKKITDAEAEVIKDAIVDALENSEETATAVEEAKAEEGEVEEPKIEETPVVELSGTAGHFSRDFNRQPKVD